MRGAWERRQRDLARMIGSWGLFADHAPVYAAHGLRVFPTGGDDGKRPLIQRWQKVGLGAVPRLIKLFPNANIGVIDGDLITRVDIDDFTLVESAVSRFGDTPTYVLTPSGGIHLWYASNGECRVVGLDGLKIDILGKGGFGVAPPSVRADGMAYDFVRGGLGCIGRLPTIKRGALPDSAFLKLKPPNHRGEHPEETGRNSTLHKRLLPLALNCETKDELEFQAASLNESLFDMPMDEREVRKIVGSVWKYKEGDKILVGQEARAFLTATELSQLGGHGDAALVLMKLRAAHGWREGEEFPLANALGASLGWGLPKFRTAKQILVENRFLEVTHTGGVGPRDPPRARLLR